MTRMTLALLLATIGACEASGGSAAPTSVPGPQGDGHTIAATPSLTFGPAVLNVNAGDAVTFAFGSVPHNVYFDAQTGTPSDIGGDNTNVSITRTFDTPGTYRYTCHIHPSMQGTVVVH